MVTGSIYGSIETYVDSKLKQAIYGSLGVYLDKKMGESIYGYINTYTHLQYRESIYGSIYLGDQPRCVVNENLEYTAIFPTLPGLGWSVKRTPIWKTLVQESVSGIESTAGLMAYPLYEWKIQFDLLRSAPTYQEFQTLIGFFNQQKGSAIPFKFLDPHDYSANNQQFGIGDGVRVNFQLMRALGTFFEPVFAPFDSIQIFKNGVEQTPATDYTFTATGQVEFVNAPEQDAVLTWTGYYYWLVRFKEDDSDFEEFMHNLFQNKEITLRSRKYGLPN